MELIVDTPVQGGPAESLLVKAKALANAELRQEAESGERAWLHAHPVLWLKALASFKNQTERTIGDAALRIKQLPDGAHDRMLREQRLLTSRHFLKVVEQRIEEVRILCGPADIGQLAGDVMGGLIRALTLLDTGQTAGARDVLEGMVARLAKHSRLGPPPDNTRAAAITVQVSGLGAKNRLNCRACGRGKFTPGDQQQTCPVCGQQHLVVNRT